MVTEGTRIEPDLFVGYATIKVRNLVGELEDFLDAHRPQVREEPALPPPVTGDSSVERPPAEHRGPGSEKEVKQKEVRHQEASKEKGSKARQEEKAPRHAEASKKHPSRPAFHGDQEIEAGEGLSQEEREKATKSLAAKKLPSPPVRTRERSPKPEVRVKKEEEAADYSGDEWPVEEPGVREVYSQSPSREDKKRDFEGSPSPKKRKHRHHHDRSRDRKAKKHERSSSSTPVAGPSRPEEEVREVRRPRSPSRPPPHWTGPAPRENRYVLKPRPTKAKPKEDGGSNKGLKKKETQKTFKEYVAWRRAEKTKGR